ncbi:MAG: hypothetical protein JRN15_07310 [Nitrososphaerota archaeon]|nr:hypothetical protein [Nitrososphaerota archaeon]
MSRTSQEHAPVEHSRSFLLAYSQVTAFTTTLQKPNEAVDLFLSSKLELEEDLKNLCTKQDKTSDEEIPIYHALLSLIHWLYPNHEGYDRLKNASLMLKHSLDATSLSKTKISESYVIGLFVQLRVLPFLIRSKQPLTEVCAKARETALSIIEALDDPNSELIKNAERLQTDAFKGLLYDGLGFSYWQLERDSSTALRYLQLSTEHFVRVDEQLPRKRKRPIQDEEELYEDLSRVFCSAFTSVAYWDLGLCKESLADKLEGEEMVELIKKARSDYQNSYSFALRTSWNNYKGLSAYMVASSFATESERETDQKKIKALLRNAITIGDEALRWLSLWSTHESDFLGGSWIAVYYGRFADYSSARQKRRYMLRSIDLAKRAERLLKKKEVKLGRWSPVQISDIFYRNSDYYRKLAANQRSSLKDTSYLSEKKLVIEPLRKSLKYSIKSKAYCKEDRFSKRAVDSCLLAADVCNELLGCSLSQGEKETLVTLGKRTCNEAISISKSNNWNESVAESHWLLAQILDRQGNYSKSASHYLNAYEFYQMAKRSAQYTRRAYQDFEYYMLAWNKIELAKLAHRSSKFEKASDLYSEAAKLILLTEQWSNMAELFLAEYFIERAESNALSDKAELSIESFDEAISHLAKFLHHEAPELLPFNTLARQLTSFCRARIILEKSKEHYRIGEIEQSLLGLASAETMFEELASNQKAIDELRANELRSMASLCNALQNFQRAQVTGDGELYLEARKTFSDAAEQSKSKSLRPLLMGLAGFAAFLFYSKQVEKSLETKLNVDEVVECDKALKIAESNFRKVGNKSFLNILKASKHILDATIKMSAAEREVERTQVKASLYMEAQKSLSLASKYYNLVGSSKRLKEALRMISAVRTHQKLMPLAHDIIAEVASNQIIYAAIARSSVIEQTPYSTSRGLRTAYILLECSIDKSFTQAGEPTKISFGVWNLGHEPVIVVKLDEVVPENFEILESPYKFVDGNSLKLNTRLEPSSSKQINLTCRAKSTGSFSWRPSLIYLDSSKNYGMVRGQLIRSVIEPAKTRDFVNLSKLKCDLERELDQILTQNPAEIEKIYTVREKISAIEEEFLRTKNEYDSMVSELEKTKLDIQYLIESGKQSIREGEKADLEAEAKLLELRIERRRSLLKQARLL